MNRRPYALLTNATNENGLAIARYLLEEGYNLVLVSYELMPMHRMAGALLRYKRDCQIDIVLKDASTKQGAEKTFEDVMELGICVEAIVYNPSDSGKFSKTRDPDIKSLVSYFLPHMESLHQGKILLTDNGDYTVYSALTRQLADSEVSVEMISTDEVPENVGFLHARTNYHVN